LVGEIEDFVERFAVRPFRRADAEAYRKVIQTARLIPLIQECLNPVNYGSSASQVPQVRAPVLGASNLGTTVLRSSAGVGLEGGIVEIESEWTVTRVEQQEPKGEPERRSEGP